ncbi:pilus assembly protein [Rhodobacteraceae bacterium 2376]|uniref:Pilus assembly protein n=1 Tax=Rhabdonatronobacter sediminivivens TaxID=2743469 RepID=A0A7Z0I0W3_9RHOB|nr:pilus assembly protein TadG-related protein [Rhabdonatronobacter sediminivivens]NYS25499.1 pilus assembly protein [Rhabdonatronobacter sediminivivens]
MKLLRAVIILSAQCVGSWRGKPANSPRRFLAHESGATAVMLAVALPVMVLGMGIGAETGYQFMTQRKLQHAADLAAHAGAARLRARDNPAEIEAAATHVAVEGGFNADTGIIQVNTPPQAGPAANNPDSVEVTLNQTQRRYFSLLVRNDPVEISARAVAQITATGSVACVLALSPLAPGAVTVTGSTSVGLNGCDIASNSNAADALLMSGNSAALTANCAHAVGRSVVTSQLQLTGCPEVREFAPAVRDPYESVAEPARVGTCRNRNQGHPNQATTLTPTDTHPSGVNSMRFCNGLDIKGNVTFAPGLYIIESGDFTINSGEIDSSGAAGLHGEGVTFFLAGNARLRLGGNAQLTLAAPTSGPFSGLLFFSGRDQSGITHRVAGTSGSTIHGAVYAPSASIELTGNSRTVGGCTQVIGQQITFTGNSTLGSDCADAGTKDIPAIETVAIIE